MAYDLYNQCYTLKDDNMWVSVKNFEIRIYTTDEGVVVDIYKGSENGACGDALASTYAFDNECEEEDA